MEHASQGGANLQFHVSFQEKVLLLLDSPASGKNLYRFVLETLPSNYFSSFLSLLFLPFRVGPLSVDSFVC